MRTVSVQELEAHTDELTAQVQAGQRLTLVHGSKTIGDIVPHEPARKKWASEAERIAAVEEMMTFLRKGVDMGGFKITDRDELYDRD
jgi:antitoxin (DNA-binding transcriptional repressor) of toxin-antitoxin stability system